MKENMIQCEDLYYEYIKEDGESKVALDGLNLEVKQGEFLVILGHNGSGKSTLAKHFNALHIPSSGNILVDNLNTREEENLWEIRKRVGMVFQNPDNQIVATIVEEDVAFGPENLGVEPNEIRKRVDEALKQVHMYEYRKHGPHLLSGGQKQRIAIAGILAMKTKCIVLDEPTAMLDPFGRKEVLNTMLELNKKFGITIVLITHFMEEAVNADRVIVLDKGNIINEGTPREIFSKVKIMKKIGLDVPQVTELAYELQKEGINISTDIINIDEMVDTLCQLK